MRFSAVERDQSVQLKLRYGSGQGIVRCTGQVGSVQWVRWCEGRTVICEVYIGCRECTGCKVV